MSGSLIGGVIGATIGFVVGGPTGAMYGFSLGSAAGGILMPGQLPHVEGPRLSDLRVQSSEYGRPIPIVYGTVGLQGNVIWAPDLVEVKTDTTTGGKGGPSQTTRNYSYFGNFAVAICDGPIAGVLRIWAGPAKRLIFDGAKLEGGGKLRIYLGDDEQLPDPLIEQYLGVGNVPAYRGTAYVVLEMFPLLNDGNALPFLTFEIGGTHKSAAGIGLWFDRVFSASGGGAGGAGSFVSVYNGGNWGVVQNDKGTLKAVTNLPTGSDHWAPNSHFIFDDARNRLVTVFDGLQSSTSPQFYVNDITAGTDIGHSPITLTAGQVGFDAVYAGGKYILGFNVSGGGARLVMLDPASLAYVSDQFVDVGNPSAFTNMYAASKDDTYFWAVRANGDVVRVDIGSSSSVHIGTAPASFGGVVGRYGEYNKYDGNLWLCALSGGDLNYASYTSSATRFSSSVPTNFYQLAPSAWLFTPDPGDGQIGIYVIGERWLGRDETIRFSPDNSTTPVETTGVAHGTGDLQAAMWDETTHKIVAFRVGGNYATSSTSGLASTIDYIDGSLSDGGGVLTPTPAKLSDIVADLSNRAGMSSYDVSQLNDTVDGYVIAKQTTVRDAIDALRPAYFFDAVESQGVVKFVKRGGTTVTVIEDEDLAATDSTGQAEDPLLTVRKQEVELPRTINVNYMLAATDYEQATKTAKRLVGFSLDETTLDIPLVLSDTKAQQIVDVNLHTAWAGRLPYTFSLPRKYAYLEPTDLVLVKGNLMRLTKITASPAGVLKCEAISDDSSYYAPHVIVTETPPNEKTVFVPGATVLELM